MAPFTRNTDRTVPGLGGYGSELPQNRLPTFSEVLGHYYFTTNEWRRQRNLQDPPAKEVRVAVVKTVRSVWHRASLSTLSGM